MKNKLIDMKTCKILGTLLFILSVICGHVFPQEPHWMPDANLRQAIQEALALPPDSLLTKEKMQQLTHLEARNKGIRNIQGLEFAQNLVNLNLGRNQVRDINALRNLVKLQELSLYRNQISDLSPLQALTSLVYLNMSDSPISDLSPLSNHTNLEKLDVSDCQISEVRPLIGLKNLRALVLTNNRISDFSPLARLTNLQRLHIKRNLENDISSLQHLTLTEFAYDEVCEIAPLGPPVITRFQNRSFPSVFQAWDNLIGSIEDKQTSGNIEPSDNETLYTERLTQHDLHWSPFFGLSWDTSAVEPTYGLSTRLAGELEAAKAVREHRLSLNPNMLFLVEIRIHNHLRASAFPPDSDFWLRDSNNRIIRNRSGEYMMDLLNPDSQNLLIQRIVAVARCGLFDGVMIAGFHANGTGFMDRHFHDATDEEVIAATTRILREVRTRVRDDFLILVNTDRTKPAAYTEYVNGTFMGTRPDFNGSYTREGLQKIEDTLLWAETQLREPQVNCLEGAGIGTLPPDSPENLRWARLFTTLSLTHSDGYVLYTDGMHAVDPEAQHHAHYWYPLWDADLGQPVGKKAQSYQNREGLFIREFTNGWVVYNRSGKTQNIQLPEEVSGVASGVKNTRWHTVSDLDGEIFLKKIVLAVDAKDDAAVDTDDVTVVRDPRR